MKSEFKAKLVNHLLNKKNAEKGFTLIELLVVIIIIGILAAIALPSFLNQASKARQSEAKTYCGSMARTQQAYYLEKQQFAPNLLTLAVGIAQQTSNYAYGVSRNGAKTDVGTAQSSYAFCFPLANVTAGTGNGLYIAPATVPTVSSGDVLVGSGGAPIKAYVAGVNVATPAGSAEATTLVALIEGNLAPINGAALSQFYAGETATAGAYITFAVNAAPASTGTNFTAIN
jgi:type IV pilus assembly protein PilA